ncbi:MAG: potassium transporter TrkA [Planctomycetes bacterium]|nr:potassium transporter TrkA [Planctomycetota bacterium]
MTAIITLIFIALFSFLAIKVATIALMMTGLSFDTASFQSYSAFFGVGFTTREAELVVNHPVRRRIIRDLILVGNIGLTSALATMVATFVQGNNVFESLMIILAAVAIALVISYIGRLRWFRKALDRIIAYSLSRAGLVRALDYELLLRVDHGYVVSEYLVEDGNPLVGKMLRHSRPWDSGVVILAIRRNDVLLPGIPGPSDVIEVGDVLVIYGQEDRTKLVMQEAPKS